MFEGVPASPFPRRKKDRFRLIYIVMNGRKSDTGRERLIRSHSSARFGFELSGNSN